MKTVVKTVAALAGAKVSFWLVVSMIAAVGVAKAIVSDVLDPDSFWHMRVADQLLREGIHPIVDHLSYGSIKEPWTPYSWLAELAMKWLWDAGGYRLTLLARAFMVAATTYLAALASLELAHRSKPATRYTNTILATAFFAYLAFPFLSFRPATAAIMLMALCAWLLIRDRGRGERTKAVWLVVPITAVIVNLHLSAIIVPMWVGALFIGALIESRNPKSPIQNPKSSLRYALLLVGTSLACLATPLLPGVLEAAWHYQSRDVMVASQLISEMRPIWSGIGGMITVAILLLVLLGAWWNRGQLRVGEWLWLCLGVVLMLRLGRFAPIFALIGAPVLAATAPQLSDKPLTRRPIQYLLVFALVSFLVRVVVAFPPRDLSLCDWLNNHEHVQFRYPCEAADWVEKTVGLQLDSRSGRLINEFNWGGYLAWRLGPQFQTLLDGRTQLFAADFWQHTLLAPDEATLAAFLAKQNADAAIVPTEKSRFRAALKSLGWTLSYRDAVAEVYVPPTVEPTTRP